ncbi:hypothetical protein [Hymenobacter properus]|uniref:Uncharacterized protein n=1 Tax=Hymenobacter properus TaxID=2791026 RepID=A0A931FLB5_9BACT|nr:hypothetical protein [Hymenobacter properus]MBF9142665.1 hypothetical protein [Hymenobacter properus]MBR7721473.1 hypothetical protein [Microvirga sp. SRT04]
MRKILGFFALLLLASSSAFAQAPAASTRSAALQYEHCILVASSRDYDQVELNYGQHGKGGSSDAAMMRTDQEVRKLRSAVAALNYLSTLGWECIGVSTIPSNTITDQTGYLLRRAK